jgi:hypothetical protein
LICFFLSQRVILLILDLLRIKQQASPSLNPSTLKGTMALEGGKKDDAGFPSS